MKDSGVKQIVLRQIIAAMNDDSTKALSSRVKKKDEKKEDKKTIKLSGLTDIRNMLG